MERKDLLLANAQIFSVQGRALNEVADRNVKVLWSASRNTTAHRQNQRPRSQSAQFHAMTRLDHNRALWQLAEKTETHVSDIRRMTIWEIIRPTQYPGPLARRVAAGPAKSS